MDDRSHGRSARKAALAAFRERRPAAGVYALRCPSGRAWVGLSRNLEAVRNQLLFTLRQGGHPHRALQTAWRESGEAGLLFEEVERLDPDVEPIALDRILKARLDHWATALRADAL